MVKLNRIYTKTGDKGDTGLGDGSRVHKDHPRVDAYGEVDEANSAIGLCVVATRRPGSPASFGEVARLLESIQHDLFDLGADLCCPIRTDEKAGSKLRVTPEQSARLEGAIDSFNANLKPLTSFVLPGGSELAASLHLARTITRRAERRVVTLAAAEPGATNQQCVIYLNRLSDLLFVLARACNENGALDVLWVPGANR